MAKDYVHDTEKHGHWALRLGTTTAFRTPLPLAWYKFRHRMTKRALSLATSLHARSVNAWAQKLDNT